MYSRTHTYIYMYTYRYTCVIARHDLHRIHFVLSMLDIVVDVQLMRQMSDIRNFMNALVVQLYFNLYNFVYSLRILFYIIQIHSIINVISINY